MILNLNSLELVDVNNKVHIRANEIRDRVNRISRTITEVNIRSNDILLIETKRSIEAILTIISCVELKLPFTFCKPNQEREKSCKKFQSTLIFNGEATARIVEIEETESTDEKESICYVIKTSGTTGTQKIVAVPLFCIEKNIEYFCSIFNVTSSDAILFSTSLQFDPSIVELFMAFHVGCKLILTPDSFRSQPHRMQKAIEEFRPTIAQFTAPVFEMLPYPDSLLSATSSLRILLLGGSHFPLSFVNSIRSSENTTRIFNVYGVTEVSCWATIFEVDIGCNEVLIGNEVDGTIVEVDSDEQLVLGGPRQCYVNGIKLEKHKTGDLVKRTEGGGLKIIGRIDRMVKHRGIRVCLDQLAELCLKEDPSIQSIHFIHFNNQNIIQFMTRLSSSNNATHVKSIRLDETTSILVTVIHMAILPINSNGKVDENELKRIAADSLSSFHRNIEKFQIELEKRLKVKLDEVLDVSFVSIGVNSLIAAELSAFFGEDQAFVMRKVLDDKVKIRDMMDMLGQLNDITVGRCKIHSQTVEVTTKRQRKMKWAIDFYKCIDGNILKVKNNLVACASHSGIVVSVNPINGECLWRTDCGVRFESSPIVVNQEIVIGCKREGVCFLSQETGQLLNIHRYEQGGFGVRSKCAFDGEFIYFTTENGFFHAVDPKNHLSVFRESIEKNGGGTSIGPVISSDSSIFATTTSGRLSKIVKHPTFHISFDKQFGPIFAEPIFLSETSLLITSVHGVLTVLNSETGESEDSITLEQENCFCAPLNLADKLLVSTQSGKLIILSIYPQLEILNVFQFDLPGISFVKTPKVLYSSPTSQKLMMVSKNGWILISQLHNFEMFSEVNAYPVSNKEVFTSPEVIEHDNESIILIAGRDDYLRAWIQFEK